MGRIVALDFGLKRTGIAITDEMNIIASGLKTIESKVLIDELKTLVSNKNVDTIVIGEPKRLDGTDSHISENVRILFEHLKKTFPTISIVKYDERFTSKMASQTIAMMGFAKSKKQDKSLVDEVSATIILQSYMQSVGI